MPPERLEAALPIAARAPTLPSRGNLQGLRLEATDLAWSTGDGDEVRGPAESLLMAMSGRPDALPDLSGAGVDSLQRRVAVIAG